MISSTELLVRARELAIDCSSSSAANIAIYEWAAVANWRTKKQLQSSKMRQARHCHQVNSLFALKSPLPRQIPSIELVVGTRRKAIVIATLSSFHGLSASSLGFSLTTRTFWAAFGVEVAPTSSMEAVEVNNSVTLVINLTVNRAAFLAYCCLANLT